MMLKLYDENGAEIKAQGVIVTKTSTVPVFKKDSVVVIKSIERNFMGSYVHQALQKFKGTTARVEKVTTGKQFNVLVQPHGYSTYIFMREAELEAYAKR